MSRPRLPGTHQVRYGAAEVLRDDDYPDGWYVLVDGVPQSYVDLADPRNLAFEYVRRIADVLDCLEPADRPLSVVHVGGAGLTLARYVDATRPGSRQLVFEPDAELLSLVRERLPWPRSARIKVRVADGRAGLGALADARYDAIIVDAFAAGLAPAHLTTVESVREAGRVLTAAGVYLLNIADGPALGYARRIAATLLDVYDDTLLMAEPSVLRGRRFGNLVLAGSPAALPAEAIARRAASAAFPARLLDRAAMRRFTGGAQVSTDDSPAASPPAPDDVWPSPGRL